ncbi:MAG: GDSL-type esterase/lipase family protein [Alphaproteobacteria bacterium]|nr:GDSL-type esterase/lipase family protein [Alphaproteobacteria bacterium]
MRHPALLALVLAALVVAPPAAGAAEGDVPEQCVVPAALFDDLASFPNAAAHMARDGRITIVAIGAASTQGTGASSAATAWPARLEKVLAAHLPEIRVRVVNLGRRGQTAREALERIPGEVAQLKPDLVIWETGTVEAVRSEDTDVFPWVMAEGVDRLHEQHADVILMDPQYARGTALLINFQPYLDAIQQTATLPGVTLFPRHQIMRYWAENDRLVPASRAEMTRGNDMIYDCIAQLMAELIERGLKHGAHAQR